ncbi:hypothetical protein FH969_01750 [Miniimonas arenae]|uniref:Uncharacterized protein n=1 Tax=Miniimonas arenae TaxID=676201 RepID=A0A5C5BG17_9MICO|nr:hypothetical protein [Miniimonas arenae]TNU76845.1 hypothetical protein FH969_01750 [Miniimonas arenae]
MTSTTRPLDALRTGHVRARARTSATRRPRFSARGATAWLAVGLVVAGSATGCSSDGDGDGDSDSDEPHLTVLDGIRVTSEEPDGFEGPLTQLLGWAGAMGQSPQEYVDQQRRWQDAVAACMTEQGFDYEPVLPSVADIAVVTDGLVPGSEEYMAQYGYGIYTRPPAPRGDLVVSGNGGMPGGRPSSPTAAAAWDEALYGVAVAVAWDEDGNVVASTSEGGCSSQASGYSFDDGTPEQALLDEVDRFFEGRADDPAFDDLNREWAACMRESGYSYASPALAIKDLRSTFDPENTGTISWDENEDADVLAELRTLEPEIGAADFACRQVVDYVPRYRVIAVGLEQEFLDRYRDALDALVERAAGGSTSPTTASPTSR